ncbi:angiopoietin-1-like [Saccostrea cucullata]|uniref:angiopoietin-1-like n=1 Tax=Saccostrea cuccullata TaxID=36930 RepID=UPI002ED349B9
MITLGYKLIIIIMDFCILSNAHSLVTGSNEAKTKDVDILRQLLNQESLFRIALTKDVENIKQYLLSKQKEATNQENGISGILHSSEEGNSINSSFFQTLAENVNNHKIEEMRNEISLQREQFSKLSENFTKLSSVLLRGFERLENMNVTINPMQKIAVLDNDVLDKRYRDCQEILKENRSLMNQNGVYTIYLGCNKPRKIFCDMTTNGGGWTVIQRRFDGSTDFNREWKDYKEGFGDPNKEYWLGNDAIHDLTDRRQEELWIDLEKFSGSFVYARYSNFSVGREQDKFQLSIAGYSGNAGDMMIQSHYLNGMYFTTKDRDNDRQSGVNCAVEYRTGGWWYNSCGYSNLNGVYQTSNKENCKGAFWGGNCDNMKSVKLMIRSK